MLICLRCALSGRLVLLESRTVGVIGVIRPYTLYRCWECNGQTLVAAH